MKIAYFDCFAGIAGDMTLAALLDCGVPLDKLKSGLSALGLVGWDIEATPVLKSGIHALSVRISLHGLSDDEELALAHADHHHSDHHSHEHNGHHAHDHSHSHAHHGHDHDHQHDRDHSHDEHEHEHHSHHEHSHAHGRSMAEIRALIEQSTLKPRVRETALSIFSRIAEVEAKMHHSTPDEIHFHEIGGVDSIIDIVGVAWCLDYLGVEQVHFSALPASTGFVDCAHGRMPVPAPATLELLRGVPMIATDIRGEMVTPTGAGIVAALGKSFGAMPSLTPQVIGCGAGKKEWPDRPNMLRVVIGESADVEATTSATAPLQSTLKADWQSSLAGLEWKTLQVIECNIDDMNPEIFGFVMERLLDGGALDVWVQPLQMKKNRPAWLLGALCESEQAAVVIQTILRETTTLGVRVQSVQRAALPRTMSNVETSFGAVRVKIADWKEGGVHRAMPEWSDVERIARARNVEARSVYQAAQNAAALLD